MSGAGAPDFFRREVLRLGYVARFAFKQLLQMQNKYKLITRGSAVLDLGCASGAWLQVACQSLGPLKNGGSVVGIDLKSRRRRFPRLTVTRGFERDAALSTELGMRALGVAIGRAAGGDMVDGSLEDSNDDDGVLQIGGRLIIKLLESEDVQDMQATIQKDIMVEAKSHETFFKRNLFDLSRSAVEDLSS
ncbi:hypothetical protein CDL15_Pgr025892 [Punica granatum]|uniref:rRNA methyltransferase 2, mitochondrial n=1 Tax=Punica granatum TaxID=22663 RepID=A0A218WBX6_PUNGR|nr:hypothetical protein CDL15_Pgr025892 [Punica granatum]